MRGRRNLSDRFRLYWKVTNRLEGFQVRWLGTSGIALMRRSDVLVLQSRGRKTGRRRRAPMMYWRQGDHLYVGGGAAGMSRVDWVANVRADPNAVVWIKRRPISVVVHELRGDEYESAREQAFERWPSAAKYERRSGRPIPYFRLERA